MQPTQNQVTDPAVTPAQTLRDAGRYLYRHGWHQGDLFTDPEQPTPAACAVGAIRMAVLGSPVVAAEDARPDRLRAFGDAVAVLADHLNEFYLDQDLSEVLVEDDPEQVVIGWNDQPCRIASHVIAAFHGAADEWDRIHPGVSCGSPSVVAEVTPGCPGGMWCRCPKTTPCYPPRPTLASVDVGTANDASPDRNSGGGA
jgi:hypothetical protein